MTELKIANQLIIDLVTSNIFRIFHKEHQMKRTLGIAILFALVLSSCNTLGSIANPVIGTWETTILGVTVGSVFNTDGTFTDTNTLGAVGVTGSGTWSSNSKTITKNWLNDTTETLTYTFNSDKTEMVLTLKPIGPAITYTRK